MRDSHSLRPLLEVPADWWNRWRRDPSGRTEVHLLAAADGSLIHRELRCHGELVVGSAESWAGCRPFMMSTEELCQNQAPTLRGCMAKQGGELDEIGENEGRSYHGAGNGWLIGNLGWTIEAVGLPQTWNGTLEPWRELGTE